MFELRTRTCLFNVVDRANGYMTPLSVLPQVHSIVFTDPSPHRVHRFIDTQQQFLDVVAQPFAPLLKSFIHHHFEGVLRSWSKRDHHVTVPTFGKVIRTEPMERSLAFRHLRKRKNVVEQPLHQDVLNRAAQGFVDRNVYMTAVPVSTSGPQPRKSTQSTHESGIVVRLATPHVERPVRDTTH